MHTCLNLLYTGNAYTGTLTNSEDPGKMPHYAIFRLGLHCLLRLKQPLGTEKHHMYYLGLIKVINGTKRTVRYLLYQHVYTISMGLPV